MILVGGMTRMPRVQQVVREIFGDRGLVVRPGYIVGPGDRTDRFSYWPQRFAAGGQSGLTNAPCCWRSRSLGRIGRNPWRS